MTYDPKKYSKRLLKCITRQDLEDMVDNSKRPYLMTHKELITAVLAEWDQGAVERHVTRLMRDASRENGG